MPFCATCGSQVEGRFCAKCGTPVAAGAPGPGAAAPPPPAQPGYAAPPPGYAAMAQPAGTAMADNVAGALCYALLLITGIVFLVMAPYNQNKAIRFHAFQSIFLNVAMIGVDIVFIVFSIMLRISGIFFLGELLWPIFGLCCFILWLLLIIQTYQGKTIVLPVIGGLAQQQA
jgi:uncharacterized membrane protein